MRAARRRRVVGLWLPSAAPGSVRAVLMVPARCGSDLLMRTAPGCVSDQQRSARHGRLARAPNFCLHNPFGRFGQRAKFREPSWSVSKASLTSGPLHVDKTRFVRRVEALRPRKAETPSVVQHSSHKAAAVLTATPALTCRRKFRRRARSSREFRPALRVALSTRADQQQRWRDS